jgi:hypothetical protein
VQQREARVWGRAGRGPILRRAGQETVPGVGAIDGMQVEPPFLLAREVHVGQPFQRYRRVHPGQVGLEQVIDGSGSHRPAEHRQRLHHLLVGWAQATERLAHQRLDDVLR